MVPHQPCRLRAEAGLPVLRAHKLFHKNSSFSLWSLPLSLEKTQARFQSKRRTKTVTSLPWHPFSLCGAPVHPRSISPLQLHEPQAYPQAPKNHCFFQQLDQSLRPCLPRDRCLRAHTQACANQYMLRKGAKRSHIGRGGFINGNDPWKQFLIFVC